MATFDPAALSRITLAVRYEPLVAGAFFVFLKKPKLFQTFFFSESTLAVWRNVLVRLLAAELVDGKERGETAAAPLVDASFDLNKLVAVTNSGRAVNAIVRLAIGLAHERNGALTQQVLEDAIDVWRSFHADFAADSTQSVWK